MPKNNYSHSLDKNIKGKFIPGFGFGASFMKYDPYKNLVYSEEKKSEYSVIISRSPILIVS
jgi:hypothetical protein